ARAHGFGVGGQATPAHVIGADTFDQQWSVKPSAVVNGWKYASTPVTTSAGARLPWQKLKRMGAAGQDAPELMASASAGRPRPRT
ncbi:bi-functional transferase/deacetylase, partial [Lentzea sp. NBRC 105346]|uniref:hypothetical protein n=1 Tax=Lentzea sp. NBRC 105346 TaxID=3032205 RepID=UPI0025564569